MLIQQSLVDLRVTYTPKLLGSNLAQKGTNQPNSLGLGFCLGGGGSGFTSSPLSALLEEQFEL